MYFSWFRRVVERSGRKEKKKLMKNHDRKSNKWKKVFKFVRLRKRKRAVIEFKENGTTEGTLKISHNLPIFVKVFCKFSDSLDIILVCFIDKHNKNVHGQSCIVKPI